MVDGAIVALECPVTASNIIMAQRKRVREIGFGHSRPSIARFILHVTETSSLGLDIGVGTCYYVWQILREVAHDSHLLACTEVQARLQNIQTSLRDKTQLSNSPQLSVQSNTKILRSRCATSLTLRSIPFLWPTPLLYRVGNWRNGTSSSKAWCKELFPPQRIAQCIRF